MDNEKAQCIDPEPQAEKDRVRRFIEQAGKDLKANQDAQPSAAEEGHVLIAQNDALHAKACALTLARIALRAEDAQPHVIERDLVELLCILDGQG